MEWRSEINVVKLVPMKCRTAEEKGPVLQKPRGYGNLIVYFVRKLHFLYVPHIKIRLAFTSTNTG
jgi:hypothetical protein